MLIFLSRSFARFTPSFIFQFELKSFTLERKVADSLIGAFNEFLAEFNLWSGGVAVIKIDVAKGNVFLAVPNLMLVIIELEFDKFFGRCTFPKNNFWHHN